MKDTIFSIFVIVGTVIGSGFISGKEIVVFFSRFGNFSFPCIILAFGLFFLLFYLILTRGSKAFDKIRSSKFCQAINIFLCLIFSSAMFAGIIDLVCSNVLICSFVIIFVIVSCYFIYKKGMKSLQKFNFVLVPAMICFFIGGLSLLVNSRFNFESCLTGEYSFLYSMLYVVLNTSNSCFLIAGLGKKLSRQQKTRVAFISALVLFASLFLANLVLLQNSSAFSSDMPILSLFEGWQKTLMTIVIFIGCLTTLFSLVYTCSSSMRGLCKNEMMIFSVSVLFPFVASLIGFGYIVTYLYPLASVMGIFLLYKLFSKSG